MKLFAILIGALATFSAAGVTSTERDAAPALFDGIIDNVNIQGVPIRDISGVAGCFHKHKGYKVGYGKGDPGIISISNLDKSCCIQAKEVYKKHGSVLEKVGKPEFDSPYKGLTVSGVSKRNMDLIKEYFRRI